ncbi:MAG: HAD family hydrolase [Nanoarchaeota archaeon]
MKVTTVIFDYDNTLEEWLPYEAEVDVLIAKKLAKKYKISERDFLREFNTIKKARLHQKASPEEYSRILWITETLARLDIKGDYTYIDEVVEYYWKMIMKKTKLFPNSKKVLETLKKKKYTLVLLSDSDGHRGIKVERVKKIGIHKYFDLVFTSDDSGVNKPDKKNYEMICQKLGVQPRECMMVGDVPMKDLSSPKKMGMTTVWFQGTLPTMTTYPYVDYTITDIIELLDILEKIGYRDGKH